MSALHYVNVSIYAPAPTGLFCADGDCVTGAIRQAEIILSDRSISDQTRLLALEQLAHFIEDAHQPLHVGENGDKSGNDVQITTFASGRARNLHALWDGDLVWRRSERTRSGSARCET